MFDFHVHSNFSADSDAKMEDMVRAAIKAGLKEMAFTDHFDPDYCVSDWPSDQDFPNYQKSMEDVRDRFRDKIIVRTGLEIGLQHGKTLEKCKAAADGYPYDFLIGSFHCACGYELSCGGYFDNKTMEKAFRDYYEYIYAVISEYHDFSVLGHINGVDRYGDYVPSDSGYMDVIEAIFQKLIEHGNGIEINTSSFRYGMGDRTHPTREMLQLYRHLGGEIITIGSDAHYPQHVGLQYDWAAQTLSDLGFRYVTTFVQREPVFHTL